MMKIAAVMPLILEIPLILDFLNLIQNVEEYNFPGIFQEYWWNSSI